MFSYFYVFLELSDGGMAYDRTSDIPVLLGGSSRTIVPSVANAGESFYGEDGSWIDFYDYDDPSGHDNSGNFCIKALAVYNSGVNIQGLNEIEIEIYPNPTSDFMQVNIQYEGTIFYKIFDISGKQVASSKTYNNKLIDITNLNKGMYFIQLNFDNNRVTKKFIVE